MCLNLCEVAVNSFIEKESLLNHAKETIRIVTTPHPGMILLFVSSVRH
jgi:hypothetical protein